MLLEAAEVNDTGTDKYDRHDPYDLRCTYCERDNGGDVYVYELDEPDDKHDWKRYSKWLCVSTSRP